MLRSSKIGISAQALISLALAAAAVSTAKAQGCDSADLRVLVKDSQEASIFEAKVRVGKGKTEVGSKATEVSGLAEFEEVPCGTWEVKVSREGFGEVTAEVTIEDGVANEISVTLLPRTEASLDVKESLPAPVEQSSSQNYELVPAEVKVLPSNPATVADALPLIPGVVRSPSGELKIDGSGEQRSSLVVNESDITDPATGKFGQTIPVDSIETMNVLNTPFLAQYGRFTQSVVAVETKRGSDQFQWAINDPFPDFRIRSYHMRGIANWTPHAVISGPIVKNRLFYIAAFQYFLDKSPNRTLPFPNNISKTERINSFTQLNYIRSARQIMDVTFHYNPEHVNYVNPDYFNPEPVSPAFSQLAYEGTFAHHYGLWGGTLDSSASYQRFHTYINAQGPEGEILRPQGNLGNYALTQSRDAFRREWLEIWSPSPVHFFGAHQLKVGTSLTNSSDHGVFNYKPVDIQDATGHELEHIDFMDAGPYKRNDLEFTGYAQDHWTPGSRFSVDGGLRFEHQRLASSQRLAPRAGLSWAPQKDQKTVFRAGFGQFYDHIPLGVYAFSRYPTRTVTTYAADGTIIGTPDQIVNVIGAANGPRSFLVHGQRVAGDFSPRGTTWNAQLERSFSKLFRGRAVYTDNRSVGLIVLHPDVLGTQDEIVLDGSGASRYRQLELTGRFNWKNDQQMVLTYTHSRAEGDLNSFDSFVGNYAEPIVRSSVYGNLPGDLPNRFLMWGNVNLPREFKLLPTIEYRNGFPYRVLDAMQNYVGTPYRDSTRFPNFTSVDARLMRSFKVMKHTIRLSVTGFNVTNHFNALAIHSNIADPQYGVFFGNYHRRFRFDFEVLD